MRAALIIVGVVVVLAAAGLIALLVYAGSMQSGAEEVRIELEDTFPQ